MKKLTKFKRLMYLAITIIGIVGIIAVCFSTQKCYSNEYDIYCNVKHNTNVDTLRVQLQALKIEYTLKNNRLTLKEFDNISFDVLDNKTCYISSNEVMQNFEILDDDSIANITINGDLEKQSIKETIKLVDDGKTFIKRNGDYFVKSPINPIAAASMMIITAFGIYGIAFEPRIKQKRNLKNVSSKQDNDLTDSKN